MSNDRQAFYALYDMARESRWQHSKEKQVVDILNTIVLFLAAILFLGIVVCFILVDCGFIKPEQNNDLETVQEYELTDENYTEIIDVTE